MKKDAKRIAQEAVEATLKGKNVDFVKEASKKFGSQCIVVAIDAKKVSDNKWEVFTHGGRNKTGIDAIKFAKQVEENGAVDFDDDDDDDFDFDDDDLDDELEDDLDDLDDLDDFEF